MSVYEYRIFWDSYQERYLVECREIGSYDCWKQVGESFSNVDEAAKHLETVQKYKVIA